MTAVARALQIVQLAVFLLVAVVAAVGWVRRRGATRAWLAGTFGLLGGVVLAGQLLPDEAESTADWVAVKLMLCLFVLFPYFLFRFMASFERPPRRLEMAALGLLGASLLVTATLPKINEDGPRPPVVWLFLALVLAEWTVLCVVVTVRLWRAGRGQPTVARRRLRLLASGAGSLALVVVLALAAPGGDDVNAMTVVIECMAIVSAILFLTGFAPPPWVLRGWRARDFEAIQGSFVALAGATSPAEVVDELLPHVVALVGAQGASIHRADGAELGRTGVVRDEPSGSAGVTLAPGVVQYGADHLSIEAPGGRLELFTTAYTPYFGRDDLDLFRNVAALVHVTLERTFAHSREVAAREALDEAQRIAHLGSWRLDLTTGDVEASDEMYRLYGLVPQSEPLTRDLLTEMVHPDDRDERTIEESIAQGTDFASEYRVVLPDGGVRWLAARGSVLRDAAGAPAALLGTCQDVTEARRLDRMRSEFVANAAHELRTPLTTVSAMATLLASQRDRLGPAELEGAFAALGRQGERARTLVSSLLDLSRLEAGRVPVQLAPTQVAQVVAAALETAPPPPDATVRVDVPAGLAAVADPDRLHDVVVNLLSNAYRYGGPSIDVTAAADGASVRLVVSDDGAGVPEEFVPELFEPFSRASDVTGTPGSGLGLTISHRLAAALGGGLSYDRAGGRSLFTVRLRAAR